MVHVELGRQLMLRIEDEIGTLTEITSLISSSNINLVALCCYAVSGTVYVMFVTEDNNAARKILEEQGYDVVEEEAVLLTVENKPGALQVVTDRIAEAGIDLKLIYGSVASGGEKSRIIIISENNMDIVMLLKSEFGRH